MTRSRLLLTLALSLVSSTALADDRYKVVRPVIIESGIAGQWMMQLGGPVRGQVVRRVQQGQPIRMTQPRRLKQHMAVEPQTQIQQAAYHPDRPAVNAIEPQFLPQMVAYETRHKPGTIIIDTNNRFLYLVMGDGQARRYGVGVGKPGFEWAGEHRITRKAEWPTWHPPKEMIEREAVKGHYLPASMEGGEANPLGARAMYLGSTLYRIHGTNAPWTIGYAVSSGCIRMRNEDVVDLYERVKVGTRVIVM
ncbi:L,D-transpeptidase [Rhizobium sp. TRM95796]|uniref:L,D-transpeptidase n=1 Tax=Rhizobium sp. TRM95796 TaxID=2979862 RepID=UPI0021E6D94D|nr:L,D-transpeptidase [Rhizobium sp. TRM95796]MCV3766834.1 L,D-transpeptidase [Rhizobium sp. TRM95796]